MCPHCYGWLDWTPVVTGICVTRPQRRRFVQSKGTLLQHDKLIDFIGRNYEADAQGQWIFQNGPQRVYVELECPVGLARAA